MKAPSISRFVISVMILSFTFSLCDAQSFKRPPAPRQGRHALKRPPAKKRQVKIMEPKVVMKAKEKQEADEKKRERDYKQFVKENRQHALDIQTPEVRERMKQNRKEANVNYKNKKKIISSREKKSGKKYN